MEYTFPPEKKKYKAYRVGPSRKRISDIVSCLVSEYIQHILAYNSRSLAIKHHLQFLLQVA